MRRRRELTFALIHFLFTPYLLPPKNREEEEEEEHTWSFGREDIPSLKQTNMPLLLKTIASRAAPALRGHTVAQRANIYTKPAKEKIGPVVSLL